jgi:hypothetical protein
MYVDPAFQERLAQLNLQSQVMWAAAVVSLLLLVILTLKFRKRHVDGELVGDGGLMQLLRGFHKSSSAIASMEFLMVFFPFLIIVMTVWQFAFMFNAQIHVGYAAYAAARSASVMIPADLPDESEYVLKKLGTSGAQKWRSIRRAAIPGVLAISPGRAKDAAGVIGVYRGRDFMADGEIDFGGTPDAAVISRLTLMTAHYGTDGILSGTRKERGFVKSLYADNVTQVLINGKDHETEVTFGPQDTIAVSVNYVFWLNVPYVGRMIALSMGGLGDRIAAQLGFTNPYPSIELSETVHMKIWSRKRTIEPCND